MLIFGKIKLFYSHMERCPITGVSITVYSPPEGGRRYIYKTEVLGAVELTDVAYMEAPAVLSQENKYILAGVCRNNWLKGVQPTSINSAFLRKLRRLDIPYNFNHRADLLLQHLYNTGGKEYKKFLINTTGDASLTYSSPEEFERIMAYLEDEGWVKWDTRTPEKITISYEGVRITKEGIAKLNGIGAQTALRGGDKENLNTFIDNLESKLRSIVAKTLKRGTGKENWEDLIAGDARSALKARIRQHVDSHPGTFAQEFALLNKAIQFCDLDHLKKVIINAHWEHFQLIFRDKEKVERYLDDFGHLRHAVKHGREITALVQSAGNTAMLWLGMVVDA
jgi:hypothetical protein